jgi:hypothetical protein
LLARQIPSEHRREATRTNTITNTNPILGGIKLARRLIAKGAVQALIVVINFDIFEDLAASQALESKSWFGGKHSVFNVLKNASAFTLS